MIDPAAPGIPYVVAWLGLAAFVLWFVLGITKSLRKPASAATTTGGSLAAGFSMGMVQIQWTFWDWIGLSVLIVSIYAMARGVAPIELLGKLVEIVKAASQKQDKDE